MSNIDKNEEKLIKALKELQNSVFGLEARYTSYCYSCEDRSFSLNHEKTAEFINELMTYIKADKQFDSSMEKPIFDFLHIVIQYMDCTFSISEHKLSSIKKIADTIRKQKPDQISTFDILITDQKEHMDPTSYSLYEEFTQNIVTINQDAFYTCVRHALEKFADEHHLNCLHDDDETERLAQRIKRIAMNVAFEYRHSSRSRGNNYD